MHGTASGTEIREVKVAGRVWCVDAAGFVGAGSSRLESHTLTGPSNPSGSFFGQAFFFS
jgi:hypothetical protein